MGSGSSKAKEAITIAVGSATPTEPDEIELVESAGSEWPLGEPSIDSYPEFKASYEDLKQTAVQLGVDPGPGLDQAADDWLADLDAESLQTLANDQGFQYPQLVGMNNSSGSYPLALWLNPAHDDDLVAKAKIQAKALERYNAIVAGEEVPGYGHIKPGDLIEPATGEWEATPSEVAVLLAEITDATVSPLVGDMTATVEKENKLVTALCPAMAPADLANVKATATNAVDKKTKSFHGYDEKFDNTSGLLTDEEFAYLSELERLQVVRKSQNQAELVELAKTRKRDTEVFIALKKKLGANTLLSSVGTVSELNSVLDELGSYKKLQPKVGGSTAATKVCSDLGVMVWLHGGVPGDKAFRQWAKTQKLGFLRETAEARGLKNGAHANRVQVQNYLISAFSAAEDSQTIQDAVDAKAAKPKPAAGAKAESSLVQAATAKPKAGPVVGFAGKLASLKSKLLTHKALSAELPKGLPETLLKKHNWVSPKSFSKGSHESRIYLGPDGQQWMFKPDKSAGGARAHAESTATKIYERVGVAGVVAHPIEIGNQTGVIQPLATGASNLDGSPSSWSQNDVDAMVRLHVAAWAVGDHDSHQSNVMRSPSGGIFAVDQGQSFKFFGTDKLNIGWTPTGNHGTPVYHQVYQAHQNGNLGPGVQVKAKAAMPVLKAFESLTDSEYKAMLSTTATEGVKHNVHWVPQMRKAAAQTRGIPESQVSDSQVAEAFLDHAVDRKNNLRKSFAGLFNKVGATDAKHLEWVS